MTSTKCNRDPESSPAFLEAERRVPVSLRCYAREVVFRTCYAFTDRAYLWLEPQEDQSLIVAITRKSAETDLDAIVGEFANALIDYALRHQITLETSSIRETLVRAALAEAIQ